MSSWALATTSLRCVCKQAGYRPYKLPSRCSRGQQPLSLDTGKRAYLTPAVLSARLAVDKECQGKGLGVALFVHAMTEIARASRNIGFEVAVVHAIDPEAVTFYARAGFTRFEDHPLHLFMPVKNLLATLAEIPG